MRNSTATACLIAVLTAATPLPSATAPSWTAQGPRVAAQEIDLETPIARTGNYVIVPVSIRGRSLRFLFDTGSPSMLNSELADELGLGVVDERSSFDGHGAVVASRVVQGDVTVGSTTFVDVPLFTSSFPRTPSCLFDGVLGSDVLPLCAWQIDLPDKTLRCSTDLEGLDHVKSARRVKLHTHGYPHAPYLEASYGRKAQSLVLFDTGSAELFSVSGADFQGARASGAAALARQGSGSPGGSIGGEAPEGRSELAVLKNMQVDGLSLGRIEAAVRPQAPSLLGAAILRNYVVTIDVRSSAAYFARYDQGPLNRPDFGFKLSFETTPSVSFVWDGSPAHRAGLRPGQRLKSINGVETSTDCGSVLRSLDEITTAQSVDVEWDGGRATVSREALSGQMQQTRTGKGAAR